MDRNASAAKGAPPRSSERPHVDPSENAWHTFAVEKVSRSLQTDLTAGLTAVSASQRAAEYGPNTVGDAKVRSLWSIFAAQFKSLIVALLLAAAAVAFVLGDNVEAVAILVVIVLNAAVGFLTEWKAEQALDRPAEAGGGDRPRPPRRRGTPDPRGRVWCPATWSSLTAGARVPADGRVVESVRLQVEEAALTGESVAGHEDPSSPSPTQDAPLGDRRNMAYLGTAVTDGRGRLLVTATGMRTEVGRIGTLIEEAGGRDTPLERKLAQLGRAPGRRRPRRCARSSSWRAGCGATSSCTC